MVKLWNYKTLNYCWFGKNVLQFSMLYWAEHIIFTSLPFALFIIARTNTVFIIPSLMRVSKENWELTESFPHKSNNAFSAELFYTFNTVRFYYVKTIFFLFQSQCPLLRRAPFMVVALHLIYDGVCSLNKFCHDVVLLIVMTTMTTFSFWQLVIWLLLHLRPEQSGQNSKKKKNIKGYN